MSDIKAGDVIRGPRWPEPVEVKLVEEMGEYVHLVGATTGSGKHVDQLIPREELAQLQTDLDVYPTTHGPSALDNDSASACHPIGELWAVLPAGRCPAGPQ